MTMTIKARCAMNDMVETSEYAEHGSDWWEDRLREAVRIATLAPSSHNSQPWRFRVRDGAVELLADRTRA